VRTCNLAFAEEVVHCLVRSPYGSVWFAGLPFIFLPAFSLHSFYVSPPLVPTLFMMRVLSKWYIHFTHANLRSALITQVCQ
jgi:hypothetical protein